MSGEVVYIPTTHTRYHPKKQGHIILKNDGQEYEIGMIGQYHPRVLERIKLDAQSQVVGVELFGEVLEQLMSQSIKSFETLATYHTIQDQIVRRDVSFVVDKSVAIGDLVQVAKTVS